MSLELISTDKNNKYLMSNLGVVIKSTRLDSEPILKDKLKNEKMGSSLKMLCIKKLLSYNRKKCKIE